MSKIIIRQLLVQKKRIYNEILRSQTLKFRPQNAFEATVNESQHENVNCLVYLTR